MRYILPIFLVLIFAGCGTKVPVATKYKISTKIDLQNLINKDDSTCKEHSLKVMQSFSSSMLMSKDMNYVVDSNKVYPYSVAQWAISPNKVVSDEYFKMLRDLDIFKSIQNAKSRTKSSWLLETKVEDFMQYYENDNTSSYVNVAINLIILDSATSKVLSAKVFSSRLDVDTLDANGGVLGLNKALRDVLSQSASWLNGECK